MTREIASLIDCKKCNSAELVGSTLLVFIYLNGSLDISVFSLFSVQYYDFKEELQKIYILYHYGSLCSSGLPSVVTVGLLNEER